MELESWSEWLIDNKHVFHRDKTEYILFGPKQVVLKKFSFLPIRHPLLLSVEYL